MRLQVRNMESDRCIKKVKNELEKLGLNYIRVELGEVELDDNVTSEKIKLIDDALRDAGLEIFDNRDKKLIKKIKAAVCQYINLSEDIDKLNFSDFIRNKVNYDYTSLSYLFSEKEGITIEKYYIQQRIELAKELLANHKLTVSEISMKLQYSSVGHLSNQFKKITGLNPSCYRRLWYSNQQSS